MHDGKTHAGPPVHLLCGKKRLKDTVEYLRGNAGSRIGDGEPHIGARLHAGYSLYGLGGKINRLKPNFDGSAPFSYGLCGIGAQVDDELVELCRVGNDKPASASMHILPYFDGAWKGGAQQL